MVSLHAVLLPAAHKLVVVLLVRTRRVPRELGLAEPLGSIAAAGSIAAKGSAAAGGSIAAGASYRCEY